LSVVKTVFGLVAQAYKNSFLSFPTNQEVR
jgi:hypothetical protein